MRFRVPSSLSRLSLRVPLMAGLGALVAMASVASVAIHIATQTVDNSARNSFQQIATYRAGIVEQHFESRFKEVNVIAEQSSVLSALQAFSSAFDAMGPQDVAEVVNGYTVANPVKSSPKAYNGEFDKSAYGAIHRVHHAALRHMKDELGFYDILLVKPDGTVVYTVDKESDFGTNLNTGPLRDSLLAKAVREALRQSGERKVVFSDFEPYAPSNNEPAAFYVRVIPDAQGKPAGVVAIQKSISRLTERIAAKGEQYLDAALVGSDGRLRSQLQAVKVNTVLVRSMTSPRSPRRWPARPWSESPLIPMGWKP